MKSTVNLSIFISGTYEVTIEDGIASVKTAGPGQLQAPCFVVPITEESTFAAKLAVEAAIQQGLNALTKDEVKPAVTELKQ